MIGDQVTTEYARTVENISLILQVSKPKIAEALQLLHSKGYNNADLKNMADLTILGYHAPQQDPGIKTTPIITALEARKMSVYSFRARGADLLKIVEEYVMCAVKKELYRVEIPLVEFDEKAVDFAMKALKENGYEVSIPKLAGIPFMIVMY